MAKGLHAYNDLSVVAACPEIVPASAMGEGIRWPSQPIDAEAGISPMPWRLSRTPKRADIIDSAGRVIADISWRDEPCEALDASLRLIDLALPILAGAIPTDRSTEIRP